ncbi:Alpha/Beta hydrolase protein [Mycotypha africana]|uniref:Alpha/Beta hydrolase protein n=1 Tax=Mycotypha africana TaxID=64632 RepID=UPI002300E5DF|nr:Alpha/Beta hydrolase protein [Mycotypha africana]KAI8988092.1 Alpha/Beta hydrolase protein [Mycotypha africana]
MESFHPGTKSSIFALLVAFLSTKKGRNLGAKIIHEYVKKTILFWIPLKYRCKMVERIMSMPIAQGQKVMNKTTKPYGYQWDYIHPLKKKNWMGHWITSPDDDLDLDKADMIIYYIHGGGFRFGHSLMYMESFIHIIEHLKKQKKLKTRIFSIEYSLMPKVTYDRTKQDCMEGYRYLIEDLKLDSKKIVIAGDSAGGNLVANCMFSILNSDDLPLPAANVQISPWCTIENSQSHRPNIVYQDCITYEMLSVDHGNYFYKNTENGTVSDDDKIQLLRDPRISPLYAPSFAGFSPTLITYGGTEIFQHDIELLIEKMKTEQVKVDVMTRSNAPHIWIISSILSPTHAIWKQDCSKLAEWCAKQVANAGLF